MVSGAWARFAAAILAGRPASPPGKLPSNQALRATALAPYLYEALRRIGDARAQALKPELLARAFVSATLDDTADWLGAVLDASGVPHVFLKGVVWRRALREAAPQRITTDVDLLVARESLEGVGSTLEGAGFARGSISRPLHQGLFYERLWVRRDPGLDLLIDVHHRLVPWPLLRDATSRILARRERVGGLFAPCAIDRVIVTAVHHAKEAPSPDVRDAFDGLLAITRLSGDERRALVARSRELGCSGALHQLVRRIDHVCGDCDAVREIERLLVGELPGTKRVLIDRTLGAKARERLSTPLALAGDVWRHALVFDGPVRAALATGRMVAALSVDHAVLRARRLFGRKPGE